MNDQAAATRRIYGRGYHDGKKAALQEQDMTTAARLAETERNQTLTARKVLDCVPLGETWTKEQVSAEMYRRGVRMDVSLIAGCLDSLKDAGLVREPDRGRFVRVGARSLAAVAPAEPKAAPTPAVATVEATPPKDTLAKLAEASQKLRELATLIDDVALEVEDRIAAVGADGEKLRALQAVFKSIGL